MNEHEHCWHSGSDMDTACYRSDGSGFTVTHFICCHCGKTQSQKNEWTAIQFTESTEIHGDYSWQTLKSEYESIFK